MQSICARDPGSRQAAKRRSRATIFAAPDALRNRSAKRRWRFSVAPASVDHHPLRAFSVNGGGDVKIGIRCSCSATRRWRPSRSAGASDSNRLDPEHLGFRRALTTLSYSRRGAAFTPTPRPDPLLLSTAIAAATTRSARTTSCAAAGPDRTARLAMTLDVLSGGRVPRRRRAGSRRSPAWAVDSRRAAAGCASGAPLRALWTSRSRVLTALLRFGPLKFEPSRAEGPRFSSRRDRGCMRRARPRTAGTASPRSEERREHVARRARCEARTLERGFE